MNLGNIFKTLESRQVVVPLFEDALTSGKWPESYTVKIDSEPYYGGSSPEGETGLGGSGDGFFHPSTHPGWGERRLFLAFHPLYKDEQIREPRTVQGEMTLSMGSALHGIVQTQLQMAGVLREENIEFEYVDRENNTRGRIDFILDLPRGETIPVELKTVNSYSFNKVTEVRDYWDTQLSMGLDNSGHDYGILLALESGWPYKMKEFRVKRNDKVLSEVYAKFHRVLDALEEDSMPEPCCIPKSATHKKCPFRHFCFPDL